MIMQGWTGPATCKRPGGKWIATIRNWCRLLRVLDKDSEGYHIHRLADVKIKFNLMPSKGWRRMLSGHADNSSWQWSAYARTESIPVLPGEEGHEELWKGSTKALKPTWKIYNFRHVPPCKDNRKLRNEYFVDRSRIGLRLRALVEESA